jgi:hypothetical protein
MLRLRAELFEDLDTLEGVRTGLQNAVRLEHATIPPYLYAQFSLKPGANTKIAGLISSVVGEEMAHMALAANLLNAIGGAPAIDRPELLPKYPGPLPGGVDADLTVRLQPFSIEAVRDTFMVIEHPVHPLDFRAAHDAAPPEQTIGMFYTRISETLATLERKRRTTIFTGDPARQMASGFAAVEVVPVTDLASAQAAIETIIEQGEGTSQSPLDAEGDLAHYWRFAEIVNGRELTPNPHAGPDTPPDQRYAFDGPPIPFDPGGVLPLVDSPTAASYAEGTMQRHLCDTFNATYTTLLRALHIAFNGKPESLPAAIGLMFNLKEQFLEMALLPADPASPDGPAAAPSFEYLPMNR